MGFYFFQLIILPFWQVFLLFYNFIVTFQVYNIFIFLELFVILYTGLWIGIGFMSTINKQLSFSKNYKILILDLLSLFIGIIYLLLNKILQSKEDGAKTQREIKNFLNEILLGLFLDLENFWKNLQKLLEYSFENGNEKFVVFNKLETNLLKIKFLIVKSIDLIYFAYVWYIRLQWLIYLIRCITLVISLKRIKQFISKK